LKVTMVILQKVSAWVGHLRWVACRLACKWGLRARLWARPRQMAASAPVVGASRRAKCGRCGRARRANRRCPTADGNDADLAALLQLMQQLRAENDLLRVDKIHARLEGRRKQAGSCRRATATLRATARHRQRRCPAASTRSLASRRPGPWRPTDRVGWTELISDRVGLTEPIR